GGATTFSEAEAVPPVPPSVEVTAPVVLDCRPPAEPVTLIENVHEAEVAMVPPERLMVFVPAVAVIVPALHVPVRPFGVEVTKPPGSVSLMATLVSATVVSLLWRVKLNDAEPFSGTEAAPNALMITAAA